MPSPVIDFLQLCYNLSNMTAAFLHLLWLCTACSPSGPAFQAGTPARHLCWSDRMGRDDATAKSLWAWHPGPQVEHAMSGLSLHALCML